MASLLARCKRYWMACSPGVPSAGVARPSPPSVCPPQAPPETGPPVGGQRVSPPEAIVEPAAGAARGQPAECAGFFPFFPRGGTSVLGNQLLALTRDSTP